MHSLLPSASMCPPTVVLLHTFTFTSWFLLVVLVSGATATVVPAISGTPSLTFTVVNKCTQTIWPAISGTPSLNTTGFRLPKGSTRVIQAPKGWVGRFWGRTGCSFNATGQGLCSTGNCISGQIECNGTDSIAATLAEFSIHSVSSMDFYDISLMDGFNLPMMIEARDGSGQHCKSTGCTEDLNRLCPEELRTERGDACQNACRIFGETACGATKYSRLFKNACPLAYTLWTDDATAQFTCTAGNYVITFCPSQFSLPNETCSQPFQCSSIGNISYPFWGGNRPSYCGFPGFQLLNCEGDVPLLSIDSIIYRVLGINHSSQTLEVARQDLWNNTCPSVFYNTTLDRNLFSFPKHYTYENVTIYYNCWQDQSQAANSSGDLRSLSNHTLARNGSNHTNQFTCSIDIDGREILNFFAVGKAFELGSNLRCNNNIYVPVNQTAAQTLSTDSASVNDLQDALASGFTIQWLNSFRSGSTPNPGDSYSFFHTDPVHGESDQSIVEKVLIGTAMIATVVVVAAFIIVYIRRRRRLKRLQLGLNQETNPNVENFLLSHENLAPKKYKYSQIKKITKSFSDKLGQGGYGSVYKGTLPHGQFVAVKLLTETKSNSGEDFVNEVASISRTSHVNIVKLLGFCYENNKRALVYEFMPNKSLDKFIGTSGSVNTNCSLDWETLYNIAVGVARGLEYLHKGCNTRIVHFDIKPQNILLDEEFCPKISDFGLAKLCKKKQSILSMAGMRGTVGYIAPEVFSRNFGGVSHKSDVYSYGMMVLEMAGARNFVGLGSVQSSENYFPDKIYEQTILQETKNLEAIASEEEEEATRKMFFVGFWCIQTAPSDRPSMSKVVEMLEGSLQSIQIPPKPFLFIPVSVGQELSLSASGDAEIECSTEGEHDC